MQDTMPEKQIKIYDFLTDLDKIDVLYKEAWIQLCWTPHDQNLALNESLLQNAE